MEIKRSNKGQAGAAAAVGVNGTNTVVALRCARACPAQGWESLTLSSTYLPLWACPPLWACLP